MDIKEALQTVKHYCNVTDCLHCEIAKTCDESLIKFPCEWDINYLDDKEV